MTIIGVEKFVSSWNDGKTLPENYVFPPSQRPGELLYPKSKYSVPLIDLGKVNGPDHAQVVRQIIQAADQIGAFQIINHGVSTKLMDDTRAVFQEFFNLSREEREKFISWDTKGKFLFYTSNTCYDDEKLHYWRDIITQKCAPLEECLPHWPTQPDRYKEVVGEYSEKVKEMGSRLLELIAEGLGFEPGYFANELSQGVEMNINHYPPCPDPTLTLGAGKHSDRSLITIVMQGDVSGLQFFKDGEWIAVEPVPDVFCVNMGYVMQLATNGRLISGDHRAVTNSDVARESAAVFIVPTHDCLIEPAKALINDENPQKYRAIRYHEFLASHNAGRKAKLETDQVLKPFMI